MKIQKQFNLLTLFSILGLITSAYNIFVMHTNNIDPSISTIIFIPLTIFEMIALFWLLPYLRDSLILMDENVKETLRIVNLK